MRVNVAYANVMPGQAITHDSVEFEIREGKFDQMVSELIDKWDEFRTASYINALPKDWLCDARITGVTQCG